MTDTVLQAINLTKDYGSGRGVFDINLSVKKGEVFGYIGTNGSGKTTTIRQFMGFLKPDAGSASVMGLDSWKNAADIMRYVSYIPGEIAFPSLKTGVQFLKLQADYLGVRDFTYMNKLIGILQLDPTANLKRMSKGMKQKTAIVAALMGQKDILIMDEPTTGLDPLMRDSFTELIREEKKNGRTIFMSSHIFEEIEEVCDKVAMIKDGRLLDVADLYKLRHCKNKDYTVEFKSRQELLRFTDSFKGDTAAEGLSCKIILPYDKIGYLLNTLRDYDIQNISEHRATLAEHFMKTYERNGL